MFRCVIVAVSLMLLCSLAAVQAGSIYTWTDENGNKRFSDTPPPEGTENVTVVESSESPGSGSADTDSNRKAYDQMVKEAVGEGEQLSKEREAQDQAKAVEKKQQAEDELQSRIDAERQKLQGEIAAIQARGLSPTFSQGMKDNLIKEVQERISRLQQDPEAYFKGN